jgi:hypothetical protein
MLDGWLKDGMFGRENYEVCGLSREAVCWPVGITGVAPTISRSLFLHYESRPFEKYK